MDNKPISFENFETRPSPSPEPIPGPERVFIDFPEAIQYVIEGRKISKAEWADENTYCEWRNGILMQHRGWDFFQWIISHAERLSKDWFVLRGGFFTGIESHKIPQERVIKPSSPANFGIGPSPSHSLIEFPAAIRYVIEGKRITKLEWANNDTYGQLHDNLLMLHRNGEWFQWIINDGDLMGKDWLVLFD